MNTAKTKEFEERLLNFSVSIIQSFGKKSIVPDSVRNQIIRSASSVGANYTEAQNASSKADFKNKVYIAKKEAAETVYWLKVISKVDSTADYSALAKEAQEIVLILQAIINKLRS